MNGYVALYNGKRTEIWAESLYAAKLRAIEQFKPRPSNEHMVIVILAQRGDGEPVYHSAGEL